MQQKVGYATGDMGISISYFALGFFYIFYLTDIVGFSPVVAGTVFFIGKLWDGVNDPLMGAISDRTRSRFGRKRVYVLFGSIPFALSFVLLWMVPTGVDQIWQIIYATSTLLLFSTFYTVVTVPYMAMVPAMSNDYDERTHITGLRSIFGVFGTILGGGAALFVSRFADASVGVRSITAVFAMFSLVTLIIAGQSVRGVEATNPSDRTHYGFSQYIHLIHDRNVVILLLLKLIGAIATGFLTASLPYFASHVLGSAATSTWGLALYILVSAVCVPVWGRLTRLYDKRRLLLAANAMIATILCVTSLGISAGDSTFFFVACALLGIPMGAYLFIPYSLVPDLVDYYEHKTGERHESIFFGLWITVHQLGIAIAGLFLGFVLSTAGYQGDLAVQSPAAVLAIRMSFGVVPGALLVMAALVLQKYGVTRAIYLQAREALQKQLSDTSSKVG